MSTSPELFVLLLLLVSVGAINVDVPSARIYRAPQNGSYFGFSVALHQDGKGIHWYYTIRNR